MTSWEDIVPPEVNLIMLSFNQPSSYSLMWDAVTRDLQTIFNYIHDFPRSGRASHRSRLVCYKNSIVMNLLCYGCNNNFACIGKKSGSPLRFYYTPEKTRRQFNYMTTVMSEAWGAKCWFKRMTDLSALHFSNYNVLLYGAITTNDRGYIRYSSVFHDCV